MDPLTALEQELAAFAELTGRETLARWRADPDARPAAAVAARRPDPRRCRERLEEVAGRGDLPEEDLLALVRQLRRALTAPARVRAAARARAAWGAPVTWDSRPLAPAALVGTLLATDAGDRRRDQAMALDPFYDRWARARRAGDEDLAEAAEELAWLGADDAGPADVAEQAEALLAATDDATAEALDRVAHGRGELSRALDLAWALRRAGDVGLAPSARWRRVAAPLGPLALGAALSRRVRTEATHRDPGDPGAMVLSLGDPRDVRIAPSPWELGLASELAAAEGLGRALGATLAHPALPDRRARPDAATTGHALGLLLAGLYAEPAYLRGVLERDERDVRATRGAAVALLLLNARAEAAAARVAGREPRAEAAAEALRRALLVDVPPPLAEAWARAPRAPRHARLRALRWLPALQVALRERCDEDWYRNPRVGPLVRAAAERGETLTVEAWAAELGADVEVTAARWAELLA
ncbi:MAG: hypothetical protein ACFCGT_22030 [Sandaracinaceae bacterium]